MQPSAILVVDEPVVVDTVNFVDPEAHKCPLVLHTLGLDQQNAQYHSGKIPQIKHIVGLSGCGEEVLHCLLVDLHSG